MDEHSGKGICRFPSSLDVILKKEVTEFHPDKYLARAQGFAPPDLLRSVQQGLRMAAELLFREGHCRQLMGVQIDLGLNESECGAFNGRSADLAFALGVMAEIRGLDQPMAATGVLRDSGLVGRVSGMVEKLTAAADCLPPGSSLFYPGDNHRELEEEQRSSLQELEARGFKLVPVDSLEEVALELGIPVQGVWRSEPYKGLSRFDVIDKGIFFGRDGDSKRAVNKIHSRAEESCPGLMILSESGVGKSSFVRAGILASLHSEPGRQYVSLVFDERLFDAVDEREFCWRIVEAMGPATGALAPETPPDTLDAVADWLLELDLPRQPVLVFDQFEQLFAGNHSPDLVVRFAHLLLRLQKAGVWIIACMRSEFYPDYAGVKDEHGNALLLTVFGDSPSGLSGLFDLKPLSSELLRSVIQGPASLAGVSFGFSQEGANLVDRIVADVGKHTDVLPLLEFLLERLYQQRDPETGTIAYEAYERMGGLSGALEQAAEEALENHSIDTTKRVIRALARSSADSRGLITAATVDITDLPEDTEEYEVIRALDSARLVSIGYCDQSTRLYLRFVHEALLRDWPRAAELFADPDTLELMRARDYLRGKAIEWVECGRALSSLPLHKEEVRKILDLRDALGPLEVTPELSDYCDAIDREFRKKKRFSSYKATAAFAILTVLVLSGSGWAGDYIAKIKANYEQRISEVKDQNEEKLEQYEKHRVEQNERLISEARSVNADKGTSRADVYLQQLKFGLRPVRYEKTDNGFIFEGESFIMDDSLFWNNFDLINLIVDSELIDFEEKSSFLRKLGEMNADQIDQLYDLLYKELEKSFEIGWRETKKEINSILEKSQKFRLSFVDVMLAFADGSVKFGEFSKSKSIDFHKKIEARLRDVARDSHEWFDAYQKVFFKLYSMSDSVEGLVLAKGYIRVLIDAYQKGFISEYEASSQVVEFSWRAINVGDSSLSRTFSRKWLEIKPDDLNVNAKLAHALAIQGKELAYKIYIVNYGANVENYSAEAYRWEDVVLDDFEKLASSGLSVPMFDRVETAFSEIEAREKSHQL
ncbi:MAG: hypothetical protein ACQEV6_03605 [Pseudomonadota bacterium]